MAFSIFRYNSFLLTNLKIPAPSVLMPFYTFLSGSKLQVKGV